MKNEKWFLLFTAMAVCILISISSTTVLAGLGSGGSGSSGGQGNDGGAGPGGMDYADGGRDGGMGDAGASEGHFSGGNSYDANAPGGIGGTPAGGNLLGQPPQIDSTDYSWTRPEEPNQPQVRSYEVGVTGISLPADLTEGDLLGIAADLTEAIDGLNESIVNTKDGGYQVSPNSLAAAMGLTSVHDVDIAASDAERTRDLVGDRLGDLGVKGARSFQEQRSLPNVANATLQNPSSEFIIGIDFGASTIRINDINANSASEMTSLTAADLSFEAANMVGAVAPLGAFAVLNNQLVPEPGTLTLFGLGIAGLSLARRKKATRK